MAIPATLVRLFPGNPDDPDNLRGMAIVPLGSSWYEKRKQLDPEELERKLRDFTPDFPHGPDISRADAVELREALIAAGGRPTRSLQDFVPEQANPESVELYGIEHGMYELYENEAIYWAHELQYWEKFMAWRQRDFDYRKKKGLVNPDEVLPDPKEMDQAELFAECVTYQHKRIKRFDARKKRNKNAGRRTTPDWDREELVDRLHVIEKQLQEIQQEQSKSNSVKTLDSCTISQVRKDDATTLKNIVDHSPLHVNQTTSRGAKRKADAQDQFMPTAKRIASTSRPVKLSLSQDYYPSPPKNRTAKDNKRGQRLRRDAAQPVERYKASKPLRRSARIAEREQQLRTAIAEPLDTGRQPRRNPAFLPPGKR